MSASTAAREHRCDQDPGAGRPATEPGHPVGLAGAPVAGALPREDLPRDVADRDDHRQGQHEADQPQERVRGLVLPPALVDGLTGIHLPGRQEHCEARQVDDGEGQQEQPQGAGR